MRWFWLSVPLDYQQEKEKLWLPCQLDLERWALGVFFFFPM
jgi:hypothetical protein